MDTAIGCAILSSLLSFFIIKYLNMPQNFGSKYDLLKILWLPSGLIGFIIGFIGLNLLAEFPTLVVFSMVFALFYDQRENKFVKNILIVILPGMLLSVVDISYYYFRFFKNGLAENSETFGDFGLLWALGFGAYIYRQGKRQREEEEKLLKENQVLESKNTTLESEVNARTREITIKNEELEKKIVELKDTQEQLIHSEKMASLGELTAGIAHEIQNPLNFVNNFADVSTELVAEIGQEIQKETLDKELLTEILNDMKNNLEKIVHHGKRADNIVKGMLQHSRKGSGEKELTDVNAIADEYLRLSYHGLRAKNKSFNATMETSFDSEINKILVYPQEIGRVLLNIITNAFHATQERKVKLDEENIAFNPKVEVATKKDGSNLIVTISDNGAGIPEEKLDKIFQPFFTTKPTGQGTGLGLSIAYDIITKLHGGKINVESRVDQGTKFMIILPIEIK